MGEIADAMINGDFCEGCGDYLGDGDGFPRRCTGCGGDAEDFDFTEPPRRETIRARPTRSYEAGRDHNGGLIAPPGLGLSRKAIQRRKKRERAEREAQNARA